MVSVDVWTPGGTELIESKLIVRITVTSYSGQNLQPAIRSMVGETFTFQQDSVPAHRAHSIVECFSGVTRVMLSPGAATDGVALFTPPP